jgi:hypothetical protein
MLVMRVAGRHLLCLLAASLLASAPTVRALPKEGEQIDPTKRAPVSTANAVQPAATPVRGDGVVGGRVIRMNEIPVRRATSDQQRAAVTVREERKKDRVIRPSARANTARRVDVRRASDRPAAIPRINADRFQRMLREYEENRVPAAEMLHGDVRVEGDVDLAEINRFVNPRATLEAQGIPVTPAGSGENAAPAATPVPVPQEKNGDAAPAAR